MVDQEPPPRPRPPGERVTEIGDYERIDTTPHKVAPFVALVAVLALYVFAAVGLGRVVRDSDRRVDIPDVEVPEVTGITEEAARDRLEKAGLIMVVKEAPNEVVAPGTIFEQRPVAGAKIELGSPVTASVSTGPVGAIVPDTVGQQGADAVALLRSAGLEAQLVPTYDERVRPGEVMGSTPAAGKRAPADRSVQLAVSNGPAPRTVPDFAGRAGVEVLADLGRVGLVPGKVTLKPVAGVADGVVAALDPAPGTVVPRYSKVDVTIAGPDEPTRMPSVVGLAQATAGDALKAAGVQASFRTVEVAAGDASTGRVLHQGVAAGSDVPAGTVVEIVVATAPPPPPTTTTTAPPAGASTTTTARPPTTAGK